MKTVLINGGSRGIGAQCVRLFKERGWNVAFTYKSSVSDADSLARELGVLGIRADSSKEDEVVEAVRQTVLRYGTVDCLVNSAAVSSFSLITDVSLSEWENVMKVNLTAPFLYSKAVIPEMLKKKQGRIINISSMWGVVGASCEVTYSASKAGLLGLTKALAKELGPSGITVNAIAPGVIETDMNAHLSHDDLTSLAEETPLSRIGQPHEVAEAVYFLASDAASFITGEVLNVSGGFVVY